MPVTATVDRISMIEATERHGVIMRMVRSAMVSGLSDTDYTAIKTALDNVGITAGSRPSGTGFSQLRLTERNPRVIDTTHVEVQLVYEHVINDGQDMDNPLDDTFWPESRITVSQVSSNKYPDHAGIHPDLRGEEITVSHTFPATDTDYPGTKRSQSGEISIYQVDETVTVSGKRTTASPWLLTRKLISTVNSKAWGGRPARTWMCTEASWKMIDDTNNVHLFVFVFQHNPDGWDPTAVYIDERTGKPPTGMNEGDSGPSGGAYVYDSTTAAEIAGVGIRTVRYPEERDFSKELRGGNAQGT